MFENIIKNLKNNNFNALEVESAKDALEYIRKTIPAGAVVSNGGSVTLGEIGAIDMLRKGNYTFLDRGAEGLTRDEIEEIFRKSFFADYYLMSTNALTEDGMLYNVDGNSNRVSALLFGPKNVIIIAGKNKIVKDVGEAGKRVKTVAAPKNSSRLNCATYCNEKNVCVCAEGEMFGGCNSDDRICCHYVISGKQRKKDRITVVIVNEELGY